MRFSLVPLLPLLLPSCAFLLVLGLCQVGFGGHSGGGKARLDALAFFSLEQRRIFSQLKIDIKSRSSSHEKAPQTRNYIFNNLDYLQC